MRATDWDSYYSKPYKTAKYSRNITLNVLEHFIEYYVDKKQGFSIIELGGANSCSFERINSRFNPSKFTIIDNNQVGLEKFVERIGHKGNVCVSNDDILNLHGKYEGDLAFSIGLIEHFLPEGTKKAIVSHFDMVKKNGIVIISFPTPTFLYKITRRLAELLNLWIFHDERPLDISEVEKTVKQYGEVLESKIIWPIFLTQCIIVARKSKD